MADLGDIPADVLKVAQAAQDQAIEVCVHEKYLANYDWPFATGRAKDALDTAIASAIMAERSRCLTIAASHRGPSAEQIERQIREGVVKS